MTHSGSRPAHDRQRQLGQGLAEFAIVMPIFLILLAAMLEFGLAFSDRLTMGNATREGARVGAAMVTGSDTTCSGDPYGVDTSVVASIQNILKSGGSDVDLSHIDEIRIYKASTNGSPVSGAINVWRYTPGSGPDADPGVGTERLDFSPSNVRWQACDRDNSTADPDSIGVEIDYDYELQTPLAALLTLVGGSQASTIPILDRTVMSLNPTG